MDFVLTDLQDGILTVTLNRPLARNALDPVTQEELVEVLQGAALDDGVRVVILRGAGPTFCAGGDLKAMSSLEPPPAIFPSWSSAPTSVGLEHRATRLNYLAQAAVLLQCMGKPTIAMLRGAATGAGMALALACDFRVAEPEAFLRTAYVRVGTSGDYGATYFLTSMVGPATAKELLMLDERIDMVLAVRLRLVTKVVPSDRLDEETRALAAKLAQGPPLAFRYIKENVQAAMDDGIDASVRTESRNMARCRVSDDNQAAMKAFAEGIPPSFNGR